MSKHVLKKYPVVGACGLDCGLCPRYYAEGTSRCPGCCGPDFFLKHPTCAIITCCVKQKGLEICGQCADWHTCEKIGKRLEWAKKSDSVISYKPIPVNFAFVQKNGIEEFIRREFQKQEFLRYLLDNYNDGRSRTFYCTASQLLPLDEFKETVKNAGAKIPQNTDIKEKARIIRSAISDLADSLRIDLRLRNK